MKKILPFFIGSLFLVSTLHAQQTNLQRAATILQWMKDTQYDSIYACFDAKMQQAISSSQLKDMWTQVEQQLGPLEKEKEKEWKQDAIDGTVVYYTDLKFQRAPLRLLVTFNADNKVSGLRLLSVPPEEKPLVAPFDSVHLEESPIEVVSGNYKLPGTLTRPKGKTHLPIIIWCMAPAHKTETEVSVPTNLPGHCLGTGRSRYSCTPL